MIEIEWDNSLNIGNAEIDAQHRSWLELINRLHSEILSCPQSATLVETGQNAIEEIRAYCDMHFECEEQQMAQAGFQDIDRHKCIHRNFLKKLDAMEQSLIGDAHGTVTQIFRTMGEWLVNHIMNEDMNIGFAQLAEEPVQSERSSSLPRTREVLSR